jgi:hypothetical protein
MMEVNLMKVDHLIHPRGVVEGDWAVEYTWDMPSLISLPAQIVVSFSSLFHAVISYTDR